MARSLKIPKRKVGGWSQEIISSCSASQKSRLQRGAVFRNLYLSGTMSDDVSPYPKLTQYLENLSSYLYSPVDLRFLVTPEDHSQADEAAMCRGAGNLLHREIRRGGVDMEMDPAVLWSLVKGKSFVQILWSDNRFEPHLIQPELFGVLREDLNTLDEQEAFFHTTYLTKETFARLIEGRSDAKELMRKAIQRSSPADRSDDPAHLNMLKEVMIGGLQPFRMAGQEAPSTGKNQVNWLASPVPSFDPQVLADLIRFDELWVRDSDKPIDGERQYDWTTIQTIGEDCVVEGLEIHRNIFADPSDIKERDLLKASRKENPLSGHHPFVEFCTNQLDGYFWGRSELHTVALPQLQLNKRIDGINSLMRRQEDPPYFFSGLQGVNQNAYAKFKKPGGYLSDSSPGAKAEAKPPNLPDDLWRDKHELAAQIDELGGFTPTLQGRGEAGVRSQAHSETLTRTGAPRFKTRAVRVERSVEAVGGLCTDILRARWTKKVGAWMRPGAPSPAAAPKAFWLQFLQPPSKTSERIEFMMYDLPETAMVTVDSHSSSPAFSRETEEKAFALAKAGAVQPKDLLLMTHPPHEEALVAEAEHREAAQAELAAANPQAALEAQQKGKKKK